MGIREWSENHPRVTYGVVGACVVVAITTIVVNVMAGRHAYPTKPPDSYFTIDDGKTFFVAGSDNYPPFDYKGQQAVHAYVFECSGKRFVGYMERYIPGVKQTLAAGKPLTAEMVRFGREMKKPGDTVWVKTGDLATEATVTNVTCPDGQGTPEAVEP
jgi:hypothetical protein